jgi:uncharacterized protein (TIGR02118 family)
MIKLTSFLAAKGGMGRDDFIAYWTGIHAPIAAKPPGLVHYSISILDGAQALRSPSGREVIGFATLGFASDADVGSPEVAAAARDLENLAEEVLRFDLQDTVLID